MTIIERITAELNRRGVKQKTLCEACGISPSTFSTWVKINPPGIPSEYVPTIAGMFDMSCDELLTGQESAALTEDESRLVNMFRDLGWEGKQVVLAVAIQEHRSLDNAGNTSNVGNTFNP